MSLFIFILLLTALIVVHEFGHFFTAKFFGIKVEEFGIGFPPKLLYIKRGETVYSINLLFFGGFVKIFGENYNEGAGNPRSFASKPRYQQALVVAAGVIMNVLFAWLSLTAGYAVGLPSSGTKHGVENLQNVQVMVVGLMPNSPAQKSGLMPEDVVKEVGTGAQTPTATPSAEALRNFIAQHQDESIILSIDRKGEEKTFVVRAEEGLVEGRKALGVHLDDVGILRLPLHLAVIEGAKLTYDMTLATGAGLGQFFSTIARGTADFSSVAGPIGIAGIGASAVNQGFSAAAVVVALISINLAIINLLPIPGLDGGRLLIIAIEGILRRPVSPRITMILTILGFTFLIGLMILVSFNDITRLIG
ncbi:MAG TPA: site-2 protease family protein [Candidatus Paceibacterota bacterium]|nr:site-2 protease family protein [Candidatus Paceibacterota bacterium]